MYVTEILVIKIFIELRPYDYVVCKYICNCEVNFSFPLLYVVLPHSSIRIWKFILPHCKKLRSFLCLKLT